MLIEAEKFHEYIYREQIDEIISFLRSNFSVKHLSIKVNEGNSFSAFAKVPIEGLSIEGEASVELRSNKELFINCSQGLKISEIRNSYVWINDFQDLISVVEDFQDAEFRHSIKINNSFNMSLKEANTIGVGVQWLQDWFFEISFKS